ncbi:MAG: iron-sulfur cluster assembly scaffold protein [Alphaproteobacteria bacterium]|nr:iron-sulfur cluster assembly scaffold protein [Alphaproteobacteria bacterium]
MTAALYQDAILVLAKQSRAVSRLENPTVSARIDNPVCGDRVTIDLALKGDTVVAVGAKVQGCALCQAAAAVIAEAAVGKPAAALETVAAAMSAYLAGDSDELPWAQLGVFAPVRPMKSRRDCVLLPFKAAAKALREKQTA